MKDTTPSTFTVHDLPKPERPRERLQRFGPEALSSQELLALIIGRGVSQKSVMSIAQELMTRFGSIKALGDATIEELSAIRGIGIAKAAQLKASFELAKRQELERDLGDYEITDPESVVRAIRTSITDKAKEHFKLILLNTRNKIIRISTVSVGTLNASLVHPREVFKEALIHNAFSVILAHNHPSGDCRPSEEDVRITKRLKDAGKIMGVEVLDHIIVSASGYFSFKGQGLF
jgi:DNA repair protein RadC